MGSPRTLKDVFTMTGHPVFSQNRDIIMVERVVEFIHRLKTGGIDIE